MRVGRVRVAVLGVATLATLVAVPGRPALAGTVLNVPSEVGTIQGGIDAVATGGMVVVAPGVYRENLDFQGRRIEVRSSAGAMSTIIDGGAKGPLFSDAQEYDVGAAGESVVAADFNGDGRTDVAMSSRYNFDPDTNYKLFVFYQGPDGSLQRAVRFDTDGGVGGGDVMVLAAGDLDGDGRSDLVLHTREGLDIFMQRNGTFADRTFRELPYASRVDAADLDGDGKADLVMTGMGITVYRSLGAGALGPPVVVTPDNRTEMAIGDVTGDGRPDLVTIDWSAPGYVMVHRQSADGTFAAGVRTSMPGPPSTLAIGDLNGDGRLDVAATHDIGTAISVQAIQILTQGVDGTLTPTADITAYGADLIRTGDVNGDGRTDLVAVYGGSPVGVMLQQDDGRLAPQQSYPLPYATRYPSTAVALADFSGDGRLDLAAANYNHGLDVLRNAGVGMPQAAPVAGRFHPLAPQRVLDTRSGVGAPVARLGPAATLALQVTGRAGIPASGVSAVVLNVTVTEPTAVSFLTAWPAGAPRPLASNLNYGPGQTVPNLVVARVGADGKVNLFNDAGSTQVVADVAGWYGGGGANPGAAYTAVAPARLLDTRSGTGAPAARVGEAATIGLRVTGQGGVPASGVSAVVLNVTVTEPSAVSYLTVWPGGEAPPVASNLNFGPGQTVPNLVVVKVGPGGIVNLYNNAGTTNVVADVAGWFGPQGTGVSGSYTAVTPSRLLDTRAGLGAAPTKVDPGAALSLQVTGRGGIPASGVAAVVMNVTVTEPTAVSFLTAWPAGEARPLASNVNYGSGQTVPNLVVVKVGAGGRVDLFNNAGATHVIADVAGWYAA